MDVSALPEAEQQQLKQLQKQFHEHQTQQQSHQYQQQQRLNQDNYDPSQAQYYDQSYYSYYQQYLQENQPQQQQQQQHHYAYYQSDYAAAYHHQTQYAPGLTLPHKGPAPQIADSCGASGASVQHHQQSAYDQISVNPATAAAIAALSQLTQLSGTLDAAERAMAGLQAKGRGFGLMRPQVGQHPYRGGGLLGGRSWGNFGHRNGSGPPLFGRGHGRSGGNCRLPQSHSASASSTSCHPEPCASEDAKPSADSNEKVAQSASDPGKIAPNRQLPQIARCELCNADCTSLEMLEQHKNGKRHKKNLLRFEKSKDSIKPGAEMQNDKELANDIQQELSAQDGEKQKPAENLLSESAGNEHRMESDLQNNTEEKPELPVESSDLLVTKPKRELFGNGRRGMKRKLRGGRGGKRIKSLETQRPIETPKSKVVIPLICDLCNVKCDTQEVFNRHLSGKKHSAKLKRFQGHQALYGPLGLQALYPPNPIAQTLVVPQGHRTFYGHQRSYPPSGVHFPSQTHQAAPAATGLDPHCTQSSIPQQSEAIFEYGFQNANIVASSGRQGEAPENKQNMASDTKFC